MSAGQVIAYIPTLTIILTPRSKSDPDPILAVKLAEKKKLDAVLLAFL